MTNPVTNITGTKHSHIEQGNSTSLKKFRNTDSNPILVLREIVEIPERKAPDLQDRVEILEKGVYDQALLIEHILNWNIFL